MRLHPLPRWSRHPFRRRSPSSPNGSISTTSKTSSQILKNLPIGIPPWPSTCSSTTSPTKVGSCPDSYALAIQTDRARFGSLTFLAARERLRVKGDYIFNGKKRSTFDDSAQLNASGDKGCSHEWWHQFNEKKKNEQLRAHAHMKMREVAHFLSLVATEETREANGKTILENAMARTTGTQAKLGPGTREVRLVEQIIA